MVQLEGLQHYKNIFQNSVHIRSDKKGQEPGGYEMIHTKDLFLQSVFEVLPFKAVGERRVT